MNFGNVLSNGSFGLEQIRSSSAYKERIPVLNNNTKCRKYAIALAYCGSNYQGLQVNPGAVTVEALLERALLLSGLLEENKFSNMQGVSFYIFIYIIVI